MKKIISIIIVYIITVGYIYSQPDFNQSISINTEFTENTTISPFNGVQVTGIGITGSIVLNSDTSFIRVIVNDGAGNEYMVYEMYQMLSSENSFDFQNECEESCFYDNFSFVNMVIQVKDASLFIDEVNWSNTTYSNAATRSANAKSNKNIQKLTTVQNYIQENNLIWEAEETDFSKLSYSEKSKVWGSDYTSLGYEFYTNGIYSISGPKGIALKNHDYVSNFDWRSRHGANISTSPYYDGDANGTGWMTPVVCQGLGCWLNGTFHCNVSEQDCNSMGGSYRTAGTCWIFGPTAYIEALINLYYNEHIDVDLSEQYIACNENRIVPWITSRAFNYYKGNGVPDEACLTYSASLDNCNDECSNPQEKIQIANYAQHSPNTHHDVRQYLMDYGPVEASWMYVPWGAQSHSMSLVGWGVIDEDELSMVGVTNPITSDWYGCTYWIYKESSGSSHHHNGFKYMIHYNGQQPSITTATLPITSLNRTDADIKCYDKDGDGYYNWGIGPKPSHCPPCPDEKDGDDSNPGLGPLNDDGTCTVINTYNASFEEDWDNWVQVGTDDQDWWRHTGPTQTYIEHNGHTGPSSAQDGNFYIYTEASCNGCYPQKEFIIESPIIDLKDYCQAQIDFYYHQHIYFWGNPDDAKLTLQVSYDEGATWSYFWDVEHDQGDQWHNEKLVLPEGVNKVRFIAKTSYTEYSDIALDNITIGPMELEAPILITAANTIWNTNATKYSNVIIKNDAVLTIENCTISVHELAKIIVEPGGKLIIDNATITSNCDKALWTGIEVWGTYNQSQLPREANGLSTYQGEVNIKNSGTVRNALDAVKAIKVNEDGSYDWSKTGGIIRLTEANIINCKRGVWIGGYHNFHFSNNMKVPNLSCIKKSTFETNDNLLPDIIPVEFIGLCGTGHLNILGNTFKNTNSSLPYNQRGTGITAYDASFYVNHICTSITQPCSEYQNNMFTNLTYGIYSSTSNATDNLSVKNSNFSGCYRSVYLLNSKSAVVTNNTISVPGWTGGQFDPNPYGIYVDGGEGFKVEGNSLTTTHESETGGIFINNTGSADNEIYNNYLSRFTASIAPLNENRDNADNSKGLRLFCNEFNTGEYDVWVSAIPGLIGQSGTGIANNQKVSDNSSPGNYLPAGNIFSAHQGTHDPLDFDNEDGGQVNYYYENNSTEKYEPIHIANITKYPTADPNTCPSHTIVPSLVDLYTELVSARAALNSSTLILNIWRDGGDDNLPDDIALIEPWDVYDEFNNLMAESPYLSDDALIAIIENESFTSLMVKLLMIVNPQCLNSDEVMEALYERNPPLPESYIQEILDEEGAESQLEKLEDDAAADYHWLRMIGEDIKRHYRTDTIHIWAKDSLIDFISRQPELNDHYELAAVFLGYGMYEDMNTCLSNISEEFELSDQQYADYQNYLTVFDIAEDLYSSESFTGVLTGDQTNDLENISGLQRPKLSQMALSLLRRNDPAYEYSELVLMPDEGQELLIKPFEGFVKDRTKMNMLKLYPNPAYDYVTVEYRTASMVYNTLSLVIFDASGKAVLNRPLQGGDNEELIDLSRLNSGTYIVRLMADNRQIAEEKLTVLKP